MEKYPIQYKKNDEFIPFGLMLEHEDQCYINHGQSVKRLAERCGTDYLETFYILNDSKYKAPPNDKNDTYRNNARRFVLAKAYEWLMNNNQLG
jgi:hypothetical protein